MSILFLILIYLSTAIGLTPGGSTHLHINNAQNIAINNKTTRITNKTTKVTNLEECWPCPVFANYTLAFALELREKQGETSVRVAKEIPHFPIFVRPSIKITCSSLHRRRFNFTAVSVGFVAGEMANWAGFSPSTSDLLCQ
jgi:hypothetical protein